nr:MAG TPA: hypothetical protein [Caudoviricetes sp.]
MDSIEAKSFKHIPIGRIINWRDRSAICLYFSIIYYSIK